MATFLKHLNDNQVTAVAHETGLPIFKEIAYALYGKLTPDTAIKLCEVLSKHSRSWPTPFTMHNTGEESQIVIRHGICRQWSILTGEIVKRSLEELAVPVEYDTTENAVIIKIYKKKRNR